MLQHDARRAALRALGTLGKNVAGPGSEPAGANRRGPGSIGSVSQDSAKPLKEQTKAELDATLQVLVWLKDIVDGLPDHAEVRTLISSRGSRNLRNSRG